MKLKTLFCAALAGFTLVSAVAADWYLKDVNVPTALSTVTATTTNSTAGTAIDLPANTDIAIQPTFSAASAASGVVTFNFNLSTDGTNYSTTLPIGATVTANGTTSVTGWVILNRTNFTGAKKMRYDQLVSTNAAAVTVTGIKIGYFY